MVLGRAPQPPLSRHVVEGGRMTKDLALLIHGKDMTQEHWLTTEEFLDAIDGELKGRMA